MLAASTALFGTLASMLAASTALFGTLASMLAASTALAGTLASMLAASRESALRHRDLVATTLAPRKVVFAHEWAF
jgi:hypothetical protein